jgi:hypothetical protein
MIHFDRARQEQVDAGEEKKEAMAYGSFLWREQREHSLVDSDSPEFGLMDVVSY